LQAVASSPTAPRALSWHLYPYHCHVLEHEDMGMMRNLRIT
jgi:FtsP/CotA-like multicopper oxidase with cupredoxin domain